MSTKPLSHGPAGYNRGCRCLTCCQANRRRHAQWRAKVTSRPAETIPHGLNGYQNYSCRCDTCSIAGAVRNNANRGGTETYRRRGYQLTARSAVNAGKEWTGPELEVAARDDLTAVEAALLLGRTIHAVRGARQAMRRDPRKARLAGVTGGNGMVLPRAY